MTKRRHKLPKPLGVACAAALVLLFTPSCPRETARGKGGRGVLLIAIDSLRADHLSSMGYDRATTPVLDGLAKQGALFTQTFGVAPEYLPAHAGLLTGCDPWICRRPRLEKQTETGLAAEWWVPRAIPSLAYEYLAAGYATAAFVDHPWISPTFGFDRGFQDFFRFREDDVVGYEDFGFEGVVLRFRRWRNSLPADRDWFAYLSLTDLDRSWGRESSESAQGFEPRPELDWTPPISETGRSYFAIPNDARKLWSGGNETVAEYELRYDQTLRLLDKRLGRMLQELDKEGRLENTTICIVGTFGVGFGESGLILDTGTLSDVDMHVPWVLRPAAGSRVLRGPARESLASTLDVAPTLLDLSGINVPPGMHGRSQLPVLRGESDEVREFAFSRGGVQHGFGVRDARYSLQHTAPGSRGPYSLRSSWTGRLDDVAPEFRDHVRDRRSDSGPGDLEPGVEVPERTAVMNEAGRRWYAWIDQAREVVHQTSWDREPLPAEVVQELIDNDVIAPSPQGN